ncbi:2-succinyl-5-enolpyruvyl-6-hydroxy-3-cyclohexene-1-carboxylic-acid synthase, partial [candidate division KSB1 bacterium]|nr:2-succinyl-5-enolpyruvyl-6-hydroxy-3-cyclohexene-1-carboxylic-acid synthase [candidate division KSB1 bacterium]NIT70116.1 2-succinyl-5-enolpyruvyl-6-hydroxy-3-cyclohexene-1-carboxylic-acid synthase [candidate division KSB1 bacterium]NIW68200.1 2-succinyl-5-enolpyruvyl-6-hydroxy-3-cyclohexene-1-carboxylic-acid synthase [candidate division KSB1 bacterium]NIX69797.1 2-succinyl-5-enolpyruvyl-6-hydroxy-3-cyclohexene-1-carboxylic-acid synthase [candidate division KSB1 bacterium]
MNLNTANINALWGDLIVEELLRNDIDFFCISPGSRSTPLTVAVARKPRAKKQIMYDERSAAFFALGYVRATEKPAVLICTSGTAAANYYPAIIEAAMDYLPMIILSADRPPELRDTAANQTIRQPNLYSDYVKWKFDMPCPDLNIPPAMVLTTVDQLVYQSMRAPGGPVHLNCMFREPLAPIKAEVNPAYFNGLKKWQAGNS